MIVSEAVTNCKLCRNILDLVSFDFPLGSVIFLSHIILEFFRVLARFCIYDGRCPTMKCFILCVL